MNALTIADTAIRTDEAGRYCLNDLHRAAGEEQRHRPKYWLENLQTQDLIAEIEIAGIPPIEAKQGLGTYVAKELVYAYAMWISPAFHLKVIRAYDALVSRPAVPQTLPEALRLAADLAEKNAALAHKAAEQQAKIEQAAPKVQFYDCFRNADGMYGLDNAARALGIPPRKFTRALYDRRFLFREGGVLVPYSVHREKGIFHVRVTMVDDRARHQTFITPKGLTYFAAKFVDLLPPDQQLDLAG